MADTDEVDLDESTPGDAAGGGSPGLGAKAQDAVYETIVEVWAVLGKTSMPIYQLLKMGRGAVIDLDQAINDPIEIRVNNRLIAYGEIVVVEDRLGVSITEKFVAEVAGRRG